jgi:hypothetical protein
VLFIISNYANSTVAPASSNDFLAASASSFLAFSRTGFGAPSTIAFASPRPRPVISFTALMTATFCAPASLRTTSYSLFSSAAAAPSPAAGAAATATAGAAALTFHYSSKKVTSLLISSALNLSNSFTIPSNSLGTTTLVSASDIIILLKFYIIVILHER